MFGHKITINEEPKKQDQDKPSASPLEQLMIENIALKAHNRQLELRNKQLENINNELVREKERAERERQADRERESRINILRAQNSMRGSWDA